MCSQAIMQSATSEVHLWHSKSMSAMHRRQIWGPCTRCQYLWQASCIANIQAAEISQSIQFRGSRRAHTLLVLLFGCRCLAAYMKKKETYCCIGLNVHTQDVQW